MEINNFFVLLSPELTPCQKKKQEALKLPPIGRFVPQCKRDGSFEEKQCHASPGQCWCVDKNGKEIEETRTRGKLNCTSPGKSIKGALNSHEYEYKM